ncbi:hypothetical protein HDU93_006765, partial [Gonapodya sp. JEL0774]
MSGSAGGKDKGMALFAKIKESLASQEEEAPKTSQEQVAGSEVSAIMGSMHAAFVAGSQSSPTMTPSAVPSHSPKIPRAIHKPTPIITAFASTFGTATKDTHTESPSSPAATMVVPPVFHSSDATTPSPLSHRSPLARSPTLSRTAMNSTSVAQSATKPPVASPTMTRLARGPSIRVASGGTGSSSSGVSSPVAERRASHGHGVNVDKVMKKAESGEVPTTLVVQE